MFLKKISLGVLFVWALLSFSLISAQAQTQSFDYTHYPKLDFTFNHLALELNIDPEQKLLEGHATYEINANVAGVDSLVLHAAHMDIRDVQVAGTKAPYRLGNDSLFISLGESSEKGQSYTIDIIYETTPQFGVHFGSNGTVWTSSLPLSNRHWLPVVDHPRVTFSTEITLTVPGNFLAFAPGKTSSEEITSVEEKKVQWQSNRSIPASSLWFATGPLKSVETSYGIKQVRVSGDAGFINRSGKQLLEKTYSVLSRTEKRLGVEYPFETFNVIILDDHRWETKPYSAGSVFLFKNRGNFEAQLRRGIYAQWFGLLQREEQWSDAEAMNLYQTVLNHILSPGSTSLIEDAANPEVSVNPYHGFSPKHWNQWQQFYPQWGDTTWKQVVEQHLNDEITQGGAVKTWTDYAESWYQSSGQPWFSPPQLLVDQQETVEKDSIVYEVDYQYNETKGELLLKFQARDSVLTELVTLPVIEYTGMQADTMEVTFTGGSDSVLLNLDPLVSYVTINSSHREDLTLIEYKPVSFVLSQLRNAQSPEEKVEAARQLRNHADNPDLQLAIMDLMSTEQPPEVEAALLSSMGAITQGATGTEQQFLDALRRDQFDIKIAATQALSYYQGNDQVIQALQQTAVQADTIPLFKQATNSLLATTDSSHTESLISFAQQVVNQDTVGHKSVFVLKKLADHGRLSSENLIKNLTILMGENYSYPVRAEALSTLKQVDASQEQWTEWIGNLLRDSDPRMRYHAVRAVADLNIVNAQDLFKERLLDEYDGRVFYEMQRVTE